MRQNLIVKTEVQLKAYSLKELAGFYECSLKIMRTWLKPFEKEIGPRIGHYYTPKQVKVIFENLGIPGMFYLN
jgi:hypothetical protein